MDLITGASYEIPYARLIFLAKLFDIRYMGLRKNILAEQINQKFNALSQEEQDEIMAKLVMEEMTAI